MAPVLGYWNIRGIAQPIRLMLVYTGTPFEDKRYNFGPAPDFDRSDWLKEKYTLGLDLPNLPYYIEDDLKITYSVAIMRYLARKHKLDVETEEDRIRADMIEQHICDFRMVFFKMCLSPEFENQKREYLKNLPKNLEALSDFLGKRNWFAAQNKLTYVDFLVYETLDHNRLFAPECLNGYQNLKDFMQRFEDLPAIKKYLKSPDFLNLPLLSEMSHFRPKSSKK